MTWVCPHEKNGQCTRRELGRKAWEMWFASDDRTVTLMAEQLANVSRRKGPGNREAALVDWQYLQRALALLRSGREVDIVCYGSWGWRRIAGLGLLLALAASAWGIPRHGWTSFCLLWVGAGFLGVVLGKPTVQLRAAYPFAPFRNQSQWEAHKPLLADLDRPGLAEEAPDEAAEKGEDSLGSTVLVGSCHLLSVLTAPLAIAWYIMGPPQRVVLVREDPHDTA